MQYTYLFIFTKTNNEDKIINQEYRTAVLFSYDVISYIMHFRERNPKYICTSVSIIQDNIQK